MAEQTSHRCHGNQINGGFERKSLDALVAVTLFSTPNSISVPSMVSLLSRAPLLCGWLPADNRVPWTLHPGTYPNTSEERSVKPNLVYEPLFKRYCQ